jgi:ribosomal-protein-serine acetyltransferase
VSIEVGLAMLHTRQTSSRFRVRDRAVPYGHGAGRWRSQNTAQAQCRSQWLPSEHVPGSPHANGTARNHVAGERGVEEHARMEPPAETLHFDQVELRRWRVSDTDTLSRVVTESRASLLPWMPWAAGHDREAAAQFLTRCDEDWHTNTGYNYAITSGGAVIGSCGLMRRIGPGGLEIGYWLHPEWTGRGLATMSTAALLREGLEMTGIDRIEIHHDAANRASEAVPRRLGFTEVERLPTPNGPVTPGEVGVTVIWRVQSRTSGRSQLLARSRGHGSRSA